MGKAIVSLCLSVHTGGGGAGGREGYLPWLGRGHLPWPGPDEGGGYLPWWGYLPWPGPDREGVPTLVGGTFLGQVQTGVPTPLAGGGYLPWSGPDRGGEGYYPSGWEIPILARSR